MLDTRPAWRTSAGRTTAPAVITEPHSAPSGGTPGGGRHPTGRHASNMMEGMCDGILVGLCAFGNNDAQVAWNGTHLMGLSEPYRPTPHGPH